MGGFGSSGTKGAGTRNRKKVDPDARYRQVWLPGWLNGYLETVADKTTDGNVSAVIKQALVEYLDDEILMTLEV